MSGQTMLDVSGPPRLGGSRRGFEGVRCVVGEYSFSQTLREVNSNDKLTPGVIGGAHPVPLDTTLGSYEASGSIVVLDSAWRDFLLVVPDGYGDIYFPIVVTLGRNPKAPKGYDENVLVDCRITEVDEGFKRDDKDGLLTKLTLWIRYILRNGKCLVPLRIE